MASSRVGDMTRVPVPLRGINLARCISSMQGTRNANVFPDPADHSHPHSVPISDPCTLDAVAGSGE